jgi:hypothetical protein
VLSREWNNINALDPIIRKYQLEEATSQDLLPLLLAKEWSVLDAIPTQNPIRRFYTASTDYEYEINQLWLDYQSIRNRLAQWDKSDSLRNDLVDFISAIYNIDYGLLTAWQYEAENAEVWMLWWVPWIVSTPSWESLWTPTFRTADWNATFFTEQYSAPISWNVNISEWWFASNPNMFDAWTAMEATDEELSCKL